MNVRRLIIRWGRDQRGVTLAETVLAIGIITMALGMVGGPLFAVLASNDERRDDTSATVAWRRASAYVARDAVNTETTSLLNDATPVGTLTLSWTGADGGPHTASYSLAGDSLVRTFDGAPLVVARRVTAVEFSRSGRLLTFAIEVQAGEGSSESITARMLMRRVS